MKIISCIILFISVFQTVETTQLREAYTTASTSQEKALVFIELTQHIDSSAEQQAYRGAAFALKAKFGGDKIKNMRKAKDKIEKAVDLQPQNIEIRMIRLSIQENLPGIAGYGKAIELDTAFIIENLESVKKEELKNYLQGFIAHSNSFTADEKSLLLQF